MRDRIEQWRIAMEEDVQETVNQAVDSAAEAVKARIDRARGFVGEKYAVASDAVKKSYDEVRDNVTGKYASVKEKVDEIDFAQLADNGRAYVRSNPGKALLASVAVGFVIGLLLRRDDD